MKWIKYVLFFFLIFPLPIYASSKAVVDITQMSVLDIAHALDKGYLTSELLVTLYLERIEAYDQDFLAIREVNDQALEEAKRLDEERKDGHVRSLLHGIPFLVKTNINVKGLATTAGAKALIDNQPLEDALVIQKLRKAGAIVLASTNMSEFAFQAGYSNSSFGMVKNAFNPQYTAYGSSGGSAVGLALSFASFSLGTDTNSSVRVPASAAGIVGLRPSFDLISTKGIIPYDITRDTVGIMSKTVEDNALILSVINQENKSYEPSKKSLDQVTIGVVNGYLTGTSSSVRVNYKTDEDIKELAVKKIKELEDLGANIVYIDELINQYYYNIANSTMSGSSFCDGFNEYIETTQGPIRNFQSLVNASGKIYSLNSYLSGCNGSWTYRNKEKEEKKKTFQDHILEVFQNNGLDLIVYPTTKSKIFTLAKKGSVNAPGSFLGSVIGYPSLTVPMGYIDGLPYGLEFFSLKGEEQLLYDVASLLMNYTNKSITNSPLVPSLYEIPEYVNQLMMLYENSEGELTMKTKEYFLNYNYNTDSENEKRANYLISLYNELKINKQEKNSSFTVIIIILFALILFAMNIYIII